ncbi:MAG: hypothetical protein H0T51_16805, partial [Pirellulales bacterium]|nr:hypothetical protein [Pirellulales bacterium]
MHSTITENDYGIVSWGNPVPEEEGGDPPAETVFTEVYSSIIWGNEEADVERVGQTDDDPPVDLLPSVTSLGFNIVGTGNTTEAGDDLAFMAPDDQVIVDSMAQLFAVDEDTMLPLGLDDFGGSTDVFMLNEAGPAIDKGGEALGIDYEQRGRHFTRAFGFLDPLTPLTDVGAVEVQTGFFVVDTLIDRDDFIYSGVYTLEFVAGVPVFTIGGYEEPGCFSLRKAIDFATKNPGLDTILFSSNLNSVDLIEDEDLNASPAPTIILSSFLESFVITEDLVIQGPEGFILEIDSVGLDTDPNTQNGTGSRAFVIDDGDPTLFSAVTMSNLTIMGGDVISQGGAIFSREDLTLSNMTFKGNNATQDGGALWLSAGAIVTVNNSTFNNNRAANNGGAIYVTGGSDLTATNSTFSSNLAGNRGGAIYAISSDVLVEYSTITLNNASSTLGSGIGVTGATSSVEVKSSIISGNVSNDVDFFGSSASGAFESLGYNQIGRGTASVAFSTTLGDKKNILNPLLEPLALAGGLVATHAPVYRPDQGQVSPAIDMGDPAAAPGLNGVPDYDQRGPGFTRVFDVLGGGAQIDVGAYELQGAVFEVSSLIDENDGVVSPGNMSLREAIALANLNPLFDVITFATDILETDEPTIFLGAGVLAPGTPADIRITSSMKIDWQGETQLLISGFALDNPSLSIIGSRMFTVDDGDLTKKIDVEFSGNDTVIQFYNARSSQGGGVFYSRENLKFNDVYFFNNQTYDPDETSLGFPAVDQTGLHGGALYQDGTGQAIKPTLTIERGIFTGSSTNDVDADGGAIYVVNAALILDDSTVTGNSTTRANSDGGAIALRNSTFTSRNFTTITGNIAKIGAGDGGGLHFSDGSAVTLTDTVVSGNHTQGSNSEGGGLAGVNSHLIVDRSIISENFTLGTQSSGGGLAMTGGSAVIDASTLRANTVNGNNSHGGGIWNNGGLLTVRGSSVIDNDATHASGKGGAVYSDTNLAGTQSTLIVNSTISGNSADMRGGGVFNADGRTDIRNSTISNNSTTAASAGAGVASLGNVATTVTSVQNSIIAGNVGTDVSFVDGVSGNSFQSLGYNVIGGGNATGTFSQAGDQAGVLAPGLAPLADNGRPIGVAFEMLTHALLAGSVAINAGDPAFNSASLPNDQRGEA